MKKQLLVILSAILLICSITGACFALYVQNATPKTITIQTGDAVLLSINTTQNFNLTGINPSESVSLEVTLQSSAEVVEAGLQGKFSVAMTGELGGALNVAATIGGEAKTTADLTNGVFYQLSALPTTFTLVFTISEGANFASYAEKSAAITLNWVFDDSTQWTVKENGYYLVGIFDGVQTWYPTSDTYLADETTVDYPSNQASFTNVALKAGDTVKAIKVGDPTTWFQFDTTNATALELGSFDGDLNFIVNADGNYSFYVNGEGTIYVALAS